VGSPHEAVGKPAAFLVCPARAPSSGCKSRRQEAIPNEASRNCARATERGKEAGSEGAGRRTETGYEATPSGASGPMTAKLRWPRLRRRRSGGRAPKDGALTRGDLALRLKGRRRRRQRSEKSAEAIVPTAKPAGRGTWPEPEGSTAGRAERKGERDDHASRRGQAPEDRASGAPAVG